MSGFNKAKNSAAVAAGNVGTGTVSGFTRHGGLVHFTTAISGKPQNDKGGTILNGGNINVGGTRPTVTQNLSLATDIYTTGRISGKVFLAVSPADSGNIGTISPFSNGTIFGKNQKGNYIAMVINKNIAGVANTTLQIPSADYGIRKKGFTLTPIYKYQTLGITSWNYETGRPTYGSLQGSGVTLLFDSGTLGPYFTPPQLVYLQGGLIPYTNSYKQRNNW